MQLRQKQPSNLSFDLEKHIYSIDDRQLISTTQLLEKHNLSQSYVGVSGEILKESAIIGNMIHDEIAEYCHNDILGSTTEFNNFKKWLDNSSYKVVDSEFMVNNDIIAGTSDLLLQDSKGDYIITEIKTTSKIYTESVSWQLSIYRFFDVDKEKIKGGLCIRLKDGVIEVEPIPLKTDSDIEALIDAERKGEIFNYSIDAVQNDLIQVYEIENYINALNEQVKVAKAKQEEFKQRLCEEMDKRNIKTLDTDKVRITRVSDSERVSYDTKAIIKDYNVDASKYEKKTFVKGGVKITIR